MTEVCNSGWNVKNLLNQTVVLTWCLVLPHRDRMLLLFFNVHSVKEAQPNLTALSYSWRIYRLTKSFVQVGPPRLSKRNACYDFPPHSKTTVSTEGQPGRASSIKRGIMLRLLCLLNAGDNGQNATNRLQVVKKRRSYIKFEVKDGRGSHLTFATAVWQGSRMRNSKEPWFLSVNHGAQRKSGSQFGFVSDAQWKPEGQFEALPALTDKYALCVQHLCVKSC